MSGRNQGLGGSVIVRDQRLRAGRRGAGAAGFHARAYAEGRPPQRDLFRHQIYATGFYTGFGVKTLPAVRESIEQKDWKPSDEEIVKAGNVLENAGQTIQGARRRAALRPVSRSSRALDHVGRPRCIQPACAIVLEARATLADNPMGCAKSRKEPSLYEKTA